MTLSATPTLQAANVELARAAGFAYDMNSDVTVRDLAKVSITPGVPWSMSSLAGAQASNPVLNVVKDPSTSNWGYSSGTFGGSAFGSLTPASALGVTVDRISGSATLNVAMIGVLAQSFWTTLLIRDNVNSAPIARLLSAAAPSYSVIGGVYTQWVGMALPFNMSSKLGQNLTMTFIK